MLQVVDRLMAPCGCLCSSCPKRRRGAEKEVVPEGAVGPGEGWLGWKAWSLRIST